MMIDKPLVFHWRQPGERHAQRFSLVLSGFAAVGIALVSWLLLPPGSLASIDWSGS